MTAPRKGLDGPRHRRCGPVRESAMTAETPEFTPIKGGWAARSREGGWAVHGATKEEAAAKFAAAVRQRELRRRHPGDHFGTMP